MKKNFALYGFSTLLVLTTLVVLNSCGWSNQFLAAYMPLAFFTVAGLDFYRTQVLENGASEARRFAPVIADASDSSFADRIIGYLFVAPFIFPARVYALTCR